MHQHDAARKQLRAPIGAQHPYHAQHSTLPHSLTASAMCPPDTGPLDLRTFYDTSETVSEVLGLRSPRRTQQAERCHHVGSPPQGQRGA